MLTVSLTVLMWLLTTAQPPELAPIEAARVVGLRGEVTIQRPPKVDRAPLTMLATLSDNELLRLSKGARVDILEGRRWRTFFGPGDLRRSRGHWSHVGRPAREGKARTVTTLQGPPPESWSRSAPKREPAGLTIESPRETAIRDDRPVLRWRPQSPRARTRLDLLRVHEGRLVTVERWRGLSGGELRVHFPLEAETLYMWRVQDESSVEGASEQAWFLVREPRRVEVLDRWTSSLPGLDASDPADRQAADVILALGLERFGLLEEAQRSWQALASQAGAPPWAARRSAGLERRRLEAPRHRLLLPLPFTMRIDRTRRESAPP